MAGCLDSEKEATTEFPVWNSRNWLLRVSSSLEIQIFHIVVLFFISLVMRTVVLPLGQDSLVI